MTPPPAVAPPPGWRDLFTTFGRIGLLSFGGPAAQIALMHREVVEGRKWLTERDYLSALSFCMLLPGPEAMQLATWIGWRTKGTAGGLLTGALFVLPGAAVVLALAMLYAQLGHLPLVLALFAGLQAAVVAVVIEALVRVSRRALQRRMHWAIAGLAFLALQVFALPFPLVILAAGLLGALTSASPSTTPAPPARPGALAETVRAALIWGGIWLLPLGALAVAGPPLYAEIALFFSKLAVLTFGGAYAVLTWMAQEVVVQKHWLTLPQMMDGLGLAETTPGPLILVTEFVGFQAGFARDGLTGGLAAAAITLWMTFAPCFLWIFAGAPWIDRLTAAPRLSAALAAITAAVVGVIANLSLWFALHVLFARTGWIDAGPLHLLRPDPASFRPLAALIGLAAAWALLARHWSLPLVLALAALAGGILFR